MVMWLIMRGALGDAPARKELHRIATITSPRQQHRRRPHRPGAHGADDEDRLAGAGAFGEKHLDGLKKIDGVEVVSLVGRKLEQTRRVADKYGIGHVTTELAEALARDDVDAVILCTPTQMHAAQAIACLDAGKHVQVEIPLCRQPGRRRGGGREAAETGLVAMVGHTRRFNPSHQ